MRRFLAVLFISLMVLIAGVAAVQVAGDTWPGGNGSASNALQTAGDTWPDGD